MSSQLQFSQRHRLSSCQSRVNLKALCQRYSTLTPTQRIRIEINTLSREGTNISDQFVTTDLSPVYSIRKADTIAVFLDALFWQPQQEEPAKIPRDSLLHQAAALSLSGKPSESVFGVSHSIRIDGKHSFSFRKAGRVVDFADSGFPSSFSQVQSDPKTQIKIPKL